MPRSDPTLAARPPLRPRAFVQWLWQLTKDVLDEYRFDGVGDLAAAITFWTLLSIPAAALALVSALSSVESIVGANAADDLQREIQTFTRDTFTESGALSDAVDELFSGGNNGVVTIAALIAFYTLSRGFAGLIRALDRAYEVDEARPWWLIRLVAIGLGIGTIVVAAGSSLVLTLLPDLPTGSAWQVLAAPLAFLLIVLWAATLFHFGPNHRTPWRYDLPGALLTAIGWVAGTQFFALYVRAAPFGNEVQTTVGAVLLALTLMYLLSVVMLVGAELNDVISRRAGVVQQPTPLRERYEQVKDKITELRDNHEHADDEDNANEPSPSERSDNDEHRVNDEPGANEPNPSEHADDGEAPPGAVESFGTE